MVGKQGGSILEELYATVTPYKFSDYINYIIPCNAMSIQEFNQSYLSKYYVLDTTFCFDHRNVNEDMLFELFGSFSNDDTITVCANMITEVKSYQEWYEQAASILNIMKSSSIESWLNVMKYEGIKGDEISLHALARIYQRHIMVHTKSKPWTTVKLDSKISEEKLHEICDVHLLYLGNDVYCLLKKTQKTLTPNQCSDIGQMAPGKTCQHALQSKGSTTINVPTTSTNSTSENKSATVTSGANTMLDNTSTNSSNEKQIPVDNTITIPTYGPPVFPTAIQILPLEPHFSEEDSTDTLPSQDEQADNNVDKTSSEAQTTETQNQPMITMTTSPDVINRECTVKLDRLNDDEINAWTQKQTVPEFPDFVQGRKVGGYTMRLHNKPLHHRYNPRPKRNQPELSYKNLDWTEEETTKQAEKRPKKRSKPVPKDGPSADCMAAHRFYLYSSDQAKSIKPLDTEGADTLHNIEPLETREVLTAEDETEPAIPAQPKGKLVVTMHGVTTHTAHKHRFKCPDCDTVERSRKALNTHFKMEHHKLFCEECGQMFATPSALSHHMYIHTKEDLLQCTQCDESFPFASDLKTHMAKHTMVAGHQCGHGSCQKWFKQKGERDKHARTHMAPELKCEKCQYTTKDIRNLRRHQNIHSDVKKLSCPNCGKMFKWHMECKRHVAEGCEPKKWSNSLDF